jgi:hypothetical protein
MEHKEPATAKTSQPESSHTRLFGPPPAPLALRIEDPDELGATWHVCRDFLDPLADALETWNSQYDNGIKEVEPLQWLDRRSCEDDRRPYLSALRRAETFLRLNTPSEFLKTFEDTVQALGDGARRVVEEYNRPLEKDEDIQWNGLIIAGFMDHVVEECVVHLRNMSAEIRRRWPVEPPPEGGEHEVPGQPVINSDRAAVLGQLEPAVRKAYLAFQYAESQAEKRLHDQEAYELLQEEGIPTDQGNLGELTDYRLPSFETFKRYLVSARKSLGENKYTRRAGRTHGPSIASRRQIE